MNLDVTDYQIQVIFLSFPDIIILYLYGGM